MAGSCARSNSSSPDEPRFGSEGDKRNVPGREAAGTFRTSENFCCWQAHDVSLDGPCRPRSGGAQRSPPPFSSCAALPRVAVCPHSCEGHADQVTAGCVRCDGGSRAHHLHALPAIPWQALSRRSPSSGDAMAVSMEFHQRHGWPPAMRAPVEAHGEIPGHPLGANEIRGPRCSRASAASSGFQIREPASAFQKDRAVRAALESAAARPPEPLFVGRPRNGIPRRCSF